VNTVSEITAYDGLGNQYTTDCTYTGGFYDAPSREFRGFEYAKQTNADGSTIETRYHQDEFFKGRQDRVELRVLRDQIPGRIIRAGSDGIGVAFHASESEYSELKALLAAHCFF